MSVRFCLTNPRHMLEHIEHNPETYVCIECEQVYELRDGELVAVEYRLSHGKDPVFVAEEAREFRAELKEQREMWRKDQSIRRLQAECRR